MVQRPALHLSAPLQNVPSSQVVLSAWFAPFWSHVPKPLHRAALQSLGVVSVHDVVVGLKQLRAVSLHWLLHSAPPAQGSPAWMVQGPALHLSAPLQNVPSSQVVLSAWFAPFWSHVPKPLHRAALQSLCVLSLHDALPILKQLRAVSLHWLLHSAPPAQGSPAWMVQRPALHLSAPLQNVPSSQVVLSGWFTAF